MTIRVIIAGAAGGAAAIVIMELLSTRTMTPLMTIPFATSIVLVMGTPEAEPAQPRALVGGHLVSALVDLLVVNNFSWSYIALPVACGALLLLAFAYMWHNLVRCGSWPKRWW